MGEVFVQRTSAAGSRRRRRTLECSKGLLVLVLPHPNAPGGLVSSQVHMRR